MAPTQKTYQNITSIDDLNKQIHLDVPVIFLISTSFLNTNDYHHLFSLIAKYKIEWLIFIGDQAEIWEDKFDELLETESINHKEYLLDVVTTVIPPFLIELMGRKSKALLLFKNRWTTIY